MLMAAGATGDVTMLGECLADGYRPRMSDSRAPMVGGGGWGGVPERV